MNINYNPESVTDKGMPTAYDLLSPVLKQVNKHPYKTWEFELISKYFINFIFY